MVLVDWHGGRSPYLDDLQVQVAPYDAGLVQKSSGP